MVNLLGIKKQLPKRIILKSSQFNLPKRLWEQLVLASGIQADLRWADVNKAKIKALAYQLTQAVFNVDGKSTFKEEFVTAGGIQLKGVNFKNFESKH